MTEPSAKRPSYYSPSLDGLRFVAVSMVFFYHAPALPFLWRFRHYGWVGVDLFLCLSAFLLTRLLSLEFQKTGTIRIKRFFIRRILRIWPLYFFYATVICAAGALWFGQDTATAFIWWLSHLTFSNNVMTAINGFSPIPFTPHLWTISLEEQAYLVLPFLLLAIFPLRLTKRKITLLAVISLGALVAFRFGLFINGVSFPLTYVLPLRADAFVFGAMAAMLTADKQLQRPVAAMVLGFVLLSTVMLFPTVYSHNASQVFIYTIVAAACALAVASSQSVVFQQSILASAPIRYLGKISYGIYIYHVVCIKAAEVLLGYLGIDFAVWQFLASALITLIVSSASYRWLEMPFLRLKKKYATVDSRPL